jgi:hypothetical protein
MEIKHIPKLDKCIEESIALENRIKAMALERARIEGLDKHDNLNNPKYQYYNNL